MTNQPNLTGKGASVQHTHAHVWVHACTEADRDTQTQSGTQKNTGCEHAGCHTHTFYQSNLIGKNMLWLANRELMQNRPPSPPSLPLCLSPFLSVSLMPFSCFFSPSSSAFSFCAEQQKQHLHTVRGGDTVSVTVLNMHKKEHTHTCTVHTYIDTHLMTKYNNATERRAALQQSSQISNCQEDENRRENAVGCVNKNGRDWSNLHRLGMEWVGKDLAA